LGLSARRWFSLNHFFATCPAAIPQRSTGDADESTH
jgi:hypothetical protein